MIVEQIDAFKSWLTAVLKPMCEADPAALAKYVLALIKKDKSEAELRKSMVGQLEVFLEGETENFVNLVFQTLSTKDYITTPVIPSANPPNPNVPTKVKETKDTKVIVQPSELPNLSEAVNGNGSDKKVDVKKQDIKSRRNSENGDKEERPPRRRSRHRSVSRNRTRSRSRSWERVKRSRSREKSVDRLEREQRKIDREKRERERNERDRTRAWRNKSPGRRYERRRSRSPRSPSSPRLRSRSRSPRHLNRNRYRTSRSRSRSPEKRERRNSKDVKNLSRSGTPNQDSNHGDSDVPLTGSQSVASVVVQPNSSKRRCRDFDEKGYCMRGEMCPYDHGVDPVVLEDTALSRVLSYNPNGDIAGPLGAGAALAGNPLPPGTAPPLRQPIVDNPYNPQAPQMWSGGRFRGPRPMGGVRMPGINPFAHQPPPLGHQRELIPVPVMDNGKPPGVPSGGYAPIAGAAYGHPGAAPPQAYGPGGIPVTHSGLEGASLPPGIYRKKFDFNRLGPRKNLANCSLELKKVPVSLNTITDLNNHFSKFGKIVNIQVQYEGDPEAALITFSNHLEASAAHRSTEAVLNNRFIKLFWHDNDASKQENEPPAQQKTTKDNRLGGNVPPNSNKVLNLVQPKAGESDTETKTDKDETNTEASKEESKAQATAAIKKNQDLLAAQAKVNKNKDEQRKEVLKIQSDLRKKKQELLEKQLSQQKVLIEKMAKLPPGAQRDVIKDTIKKTQESIEDIKKDIERSTLLAKNASVPVRKSKEETQKELLDMELDLIAKQQEGADTTELQKKLTELKARASFITRGRGRGRGVGVRYIPITSRHLLIKNNLLDNKLKGNIKTVTKIVNNVSTPSVSLPTVPSMAANTSTFQKQHITLDQRPTKLLVSGYETEEQDPVLSHFQQFGEIVDYTIDTSLPSITLNYKTRKDAESALLKGKHFQDRTLSITWQTGNTHRLQTQRSGGSSTRTVLLSESEEEHLIDQSLLEGDDELGPETEEALLQDDEDEDEEDRSWRR